MKTSLKKLTNTPFQKTLLLIEVFLILAFQKVLVNITPFRFFKSLNQLLEFECGVQSEKIVWAVKTIANKIPLDFTCLVQAAAVKMLLGKKSNSKICIGIIKTDLNEFYAHAWVLQNEKIIIGESINFISILEWN